MEALDGAPSAVEQRALADWIVDGGLDRRLRRLRHALLERRLALETELRSQFGDGIEIDDPSRDPVVAARLALGDPVAAGLVAAARAVGVAIVPPDDDGRLTLGHAALAEPDLVEAVARLGRAVDALDPTARRPPPDPDRPLRGAIVEGHLPEPRIRDRQAHRHRRSGSAARARVDSSPSGVRWSGGGDPRRSRSRVRSGQSSAAKP